MDKAVQALLNAPNFAQLATVNADGSPHIDTVWFLFEENQLCVATTQATKKAKNLSHNPDGYIVVTHKDNPYEQVQIKVRLNRMESDDDMAICDRIARHYTGRAFPQRKHKGRVAFYLDIIKCKYHIARV